MQRSRLVSLVDDDESMRESLSDFLRSYGIEVEAFASAETFLSSSALDRTGCLVLDVAMPGMSGPGLQQELARRGLGLPIVFITAHEDEALRMQVLKRGAVACLFKPFDEAEILEKVRAALGKT